MSKFNTPKGVADATTNLAGGSAFQQSPELELTSILLTSFVDDQYYRSSADTLKRVQQLVGMVGADFAGKAAVYARHEFGMRSITHYLAAVIASLSPRPVKDFYTAVVKRVDDITEILAAYETYVKGKLSSSMKKGLAKSFDKFSDYHIAKYKGNDKLWSLVDAVNILHPKPNEHNIKGLMGLIKGTLAQTETWEAKVSEAGKKEDKIVAKKEAWIEMLTKKKLGYLALVRNINNIVKAAPEYIPVLCQQLTDKMAVRKSLIFPFQLYTAFDIVLNNHDMLATAKKPVLEALEIAMGYSADNVPLFEGRTLVACDTSGSMSGKPWTIAQVMAAIFLKSQACDVMSFSSSAQYAKINPLDSIFTIGKNIPFLSGGTNFDAIFARADRAYDRILILSDGESWMFSHKNASNQPYNMYCNNWKVRPWVYTFDFAGYGTTQFKGDKVIQLAGYSDKVFDLMKFVEQDRDVLIKKIKSINFRDYINGRQSVRPDRETSDEAGDNS